MKRGLEIIPVSSVDEVLKHALTKPLTPIEWIEPADVDPVATNNKDDDRSIVTH